MLDHCKWRAAMICCGGAGELDPALSRACVCLFSLSGERERKTGKGEKNNPTTTLDQSCIIGCFFFKKKKTGALVLPFTPPASHSRATAKFSGGRK